MDFAAAVEKMTRKVAADLFRNARATLADKLDWKPSSDARSILGVLCDVTARNTIFFPQMMRGEDSEEQRRAMEQQLMAGVSWPDIDSCEKALYEGLEEFLAALRATEDFDAMLTIPFSGERATKGEFALAALHALTYFNGQVCYIQTLYGDVERH